LHAVFICADGRYRQSASASCGLWPKIRRYSQLVYLMNSADLIAELKPAIAAARGKVVELRGLL